MFNSSNNSNSNTNTNLYNTTNPLECDSFHHLYQKLVKQEEEEQIATMPSQTIHFPLYHTNTTPMYSTLSSHTTSNMLLPPQSRLSTRQSIPSLTISNNDTFTQDGITNSSVSTIPMQNHALDLSPNSFHLLANFLSTHSTTNGITNNVVESQQSSLLQPPTQKYSHSITKQTIANGIRQEPTTNWSFHLQPSSTVYHTNNPISTTVNKTVQYATVNNTSTIIVNNNSNNTVLQIPPPNIAPQQKVETTSPPSSHTNSPSPTEEEPSYTIRYEQDGAKVYVCKECSKAFNRRSDLKTHQRIHSNEKPYHCLYCEKYFTTSSNLRRHERIHTGSKPYTCQTCNKAFSQTSHLKRHRTIHDKQ